MFIVSNLVLLLFLSTMSMLMMLLILLLHCKPISIHHIKHVLWKRSHFYKKNIYFLSHRNNWDKQTPNPFYLLFKDGENTPQIFSLYQCQSNPRCAEQHRVRLHSVLNSSESGSIVCRTAQSQTSRCAEQHSVRLHSVLNSSESGSIVCRTAQSQAL